MLNFAQGCDKSKNQFDILDICFLAFTQPLLCRLCSPDPTMERSEKHKSPEGHRHTVSANSSSESSAALPVRVNIPLLPTRSLPALFEQQQHRF